MEMENGKWKMENGNILEVAKERSKAVRKGKWEQKKRKERRRGEEKCLPSKYDNTIDVVLWKE